jgi:hypothetical protein
VTDDQPPIPGAPEPPRRPPKRPRGGDAGARLTQALLRIDALETRSRELQDESTKLRSTVDWMRGLYDKAPPPFHWPDLKPEELALRWPQFIRWVDEVLLARRPDVKALLKPCWYEHVDCLDHVTALWLAWLGAYRHPKRKHTDPADWTEKHLPALRDVLKDYLGAPRDDVCKLGHDRRDPRWTATPGPPSTTRADSPSRPSTPATDGSTPPASPSS